MNTRTRPQRPVQFALCLAAGVALTLTACGSDDDASSGGGGGDIDVFCEQIAAASDSSSEMTDAEELASLQAVADAAPSEISDEMDALVSAFAKLQTFDAEAASEDEMADFLAIADGVEEASTKVEEFAKENCPDLPADAFGTD